MLIIGMMDTFYAWSKQHIFFWALIGFNIPTSFRPNPKGSCQFISRECLFCNDWFNRTVFLNARVTVVFLVLSSFFYSFEGVFLWTVRIKYAERNESFFRFGISPSDLLGLCDDQDLGVVAGTCAYRFNKRHQDVLTSDLCGLENKWNIPLAETVVDDHSLVSLEVDAGACTLSAFVNGRKVPGAISHICLPLHFGMSGYLGQSFTTVFFQHLADPTPSSVVCKFYKCKPKKQKKYIV